MQDQATETATARGVELAKALSDLAAAAQGLALVSGPEARLASLEEEIASLSSSEDLASIKTRLRAGIVMARAEVLQERQKISDLLTTAIAKLAEPADSEAQAASPAPLRDQLTGLPARPYAEAELIRAYQEAGDCFLAIFVVKRLALINAKFGFARGDQVLLKVVAHLAQSLPDYNTFFRWAPCAFVTMAPPGTAFRELRSKVQLIELTRITPTLEWEGHNAMVPVALDCRVVSVKDFSNIPELFLRLDTYASDV